MRHVLAALVENKPGTLARILNLFRRRGFNIESAAVGETDDPGISRLTIVVNGDNNVVEQVIKQLNKLIEVIKISNLSQDRMVGRELAMIKVAVDKESLSEIIGLSEIFRTKIIDVSTRSLIIEITGDEDKVNAFVDIMRRFGIKEMARTGLVALARGQKATEIERED
ncbi:MAG: acetolactate synthase small subunit [Candidatus Methanoliparum thermophilum]|uniref:Acetolactate synthase small subunit n=1 Tax=Methanoliparum thermophilum TaxID=2491083 RepID=A0A520KQJ7_METT2|nr:acetolactate synthase small subunit [Candidatus Methanoliparum sp. LAM-1]RZN63807.1 MAG: acetolactate synthase small subunit [Candidatus Methanoliparum thermophilum]BDC36469.1 acetolactate synthase small subunit [Candidatus Methanoliparum sp. LAM-1]